MATKKPAAKKGAAPTASSAAVTFNAGDKKRIDDASRVIAAAVKRAVASQPTGSKLKSPLILGIWLNPKTKEIEIINQFEM